MYDSYVYYGNLNTTFQLLKDIKNEIGKAEERKKNKVLI